jgi:membrane protein required for colicin V production
MNVFDIVLIVFIGIFTIKGFKNGFIKELGSLVALIIGIFISMRFSGFIESKLRTEGFFSSEYLPVISYAITFIGVVILVFLLTKALDQFVKLIKLQWLNRLAGVIFGTLKIIIILGSIFFLLTILNGKLFFLPEDIIEKSVLFKPILSVFEFIFPYVERFIN